MKGLNIFYRHKKCCFPFLMPSAAEGATKQATKKSRKADALRYDYLPRIHSKNWENSTYIFKQVFFFKNNKITFDENENKFFLQKKILSAFAGWKRLFTCSGVQK